MKGLKKCYGLLLVLPIMLGLSLSVFSNVSALKYPINNLDFSPDTIEFDTIYDTYTQQDVFIEYEKTHQFTISFPSDKLPSNFQFPHVWEYEGGYQSTGICNLLHYFDGVYYYLSPSTLVVSYSIKNFESTPLSIYSVVGERSPIDWDHWNIWDTSAIPYNICNIYGYPYVRAEGENPGIFSKMPKWNFDSLLSIPAVNEQSKYISNIPYFYAFNTLGLRGQNREDTELVNFDSLSSQDIFNAPLGTFNDMTISLSNLFSSPNTDPSGDPDIPVDVYNFSITGRLNFFGPYETGTYAGIKLLITDYNDDNFSTEFLDTKTVTGNTVYLPDGTDINKDCFFTENHSGTVDTNGNYIDFVCSYNPSVDGGKESVIDFDKLSISIRFTGDGTSSSAEPWHQFNFLSSSYQFAFQDFNIITNGDDTPSGFSGSPTGTGGNLPSQPGHSNINDPSGILPGFSLDKLFNFNVLNPFIGIFALFTHSNECVNIPNLAGMLHAEQTTYCPWFDSNTRSILTPVFGLVGTMLIFGFVMRWLGSSSGNFFEDSSSETLTYGKWYGEGRGFKRTNRTNPNRRINK